jgi:hypothetical protein
MKENDNRLNDKIALHLGRLIIELASAEIRDDDNRKMIDAQKAEIEKLRAELSGK